MIIFVYIVLLLLMVLALFVSSKRIALKGKYIPSSVCVIIFSYTLNEGLRFGRGVDYNYYGLDYESFIDSGESGQNIGFLLFEHFMGALGLPWQCCIIVMSFLFIWGVLLLMKHYKEVHHIVLPIFLLMTLIFVENMVRWYMAFSIFLMALSFQLSKPCELNKNYVFLSLIACTIHYGFLPIPIVFYLLGKLKKPILSPSIILLIFYSIVFTFQTSFMMNFISIFKMLTSMSDRFEPYGDNAEFWLTSGNAGEEMSTYPGITDMALATIVVSYGYNAVKSLGYKYVYMYNIFVIGVFLMPLGTQVELVGRYYLTFYHFISIVIGCIIIEARLNKHLNYNIIVSLLIIAVGANVGRRCFISPFFHHPDQYLYIWDSEGKSYDSMLDIWKDGDK